MSSTTILQVPISKALRVKAGAAASSQGFSSLQEAIRIFLHQLSTRAISVKFEPTPVQLSRRAIQRYDKMSDDMEAGGVTPVGFENIDEMMDYLHSSE